MSDHRSIKSIFSCHFEQRWEAPRFATATAVKRPLNRKKRREGSAQRQMTIETNSIVKKAS